MSTQDFPAVTPTEPPATAVVRYPVAAPPSGEQKGNTMSNDLMITNQDTQFAPNPTPMGLIHLAVSRGADINTIERLVALQEKMRSQAAEQEFNSAMNRAQAQMGRISTDATNPQTRSKYASYAALDRAVRPIYSKEGFSLSFDTGDSPNADTVRAICHVSHTAGHTRTYHVDMPADGKGAKGGDVMTKTHATGAAMTYGQRYLLKYIFNIAIGEEDTDGVLLTDGLKDYLDIIRNSATVNELSAAFKEAFNNCQNSKEKAVMIDAYEQRKKELK